MVLFKGQRRIKQFNQTALLDFPNVILANESNPESETSHFVAVWMLKKMYPPSYSVSK